MINLKLRDEIQNIYLFIDVYIILNYYKWPTLNEFDKLIESTNRNEILNLSKYIFYANKIRNEFDN